jgi:hypothetical protein
MVMVDDEINNDIEMYLRCAHFEDLADAQVRYEMHCPMKHVQGYTRSRWTPPLGNYLLHNAPAASRATANKTAMLKYIYFAGRFDGHGNALVRYCMHRPMEKVQGFTRSY